MNHQHAAHPVRHTQTRKSSTQEGKRGDFLVAADPLTPWLRLAVSYSGHNLFSGVGRG